MSIKKNWIPKEMEKTVATGLGALVFGGAIAIGLIFGEPNEGVKFEAWKEKNREKTYSIECYDSLGNKVHLSRYSEPFDPLKIPQLDPAICSCKYVERKTPK